MDFSRNSIRNRLDDIKYGDTRAANRVRYFIKSALAAAVLICAVTAVSLGLGAVTGIIENSPEVKKLTFSPVGYASKTYDSAGNHIATLVQAGSNREEAKYEELPENLINAVVAIEDQRFWEHDGIDLRSISRAVKGLLTGDSSAGGGSTITQQLIKNSVFNGGMEEGFALYERKFQEWYIALSLENQPGKKKEEIKKEILTDYLNTINLGSNTLGVKVAARRYFGKEVKDLDLAECTVLASITKNPSRLNPLKHPENNQDRRLEVIRKMEAQGYITESQAKAASSEEVYDRIRKYNEERASESTDVYSFFTDQLIAECLKSFKEELSLTEKEARDLLYSGGLTIYTTQDPKLQKIVDEEINDPENYDTEKYSIRWRLSLTKEDGSIVHYDEFNVCDMVKESDPDFTNLFSSKDAAAAAVEAFRKTVVSKNDTVISETLDYTQEPQISFVLIDQRTREVKAVSGGRGEKEYSLTTNRATNTYRQPGSTFKVISAFAPAIEENGANLSTVYYDSRYELAEKEFRNWWRYGQYFGWSSIREGIEFSMNIVAVRCLVETVTPEEAFEFAGRLGITSLTKEDVSAAMALGGLTKGVTNLELTNAFASIADGGIYSDYKFFTKIYDHEGNILIDHSETPETRVMRESTAFLLTDAMRMSVVPHTKWSSDFTVNNTSSRSRLDNMTCAGKSGTTTSNRDVWFVGFTPYYTAGIWAGCDENQPLSDSETGEYNGGTSFHKDIWKKIMERVSEGQEDPGQFEKPDTIVTKAVCRKSGLLATDACAHDVRAGENAIYYEYFDAENVPAEYCSHHNADGSVVITGADLERGETDDTRVNQAIAAEALASEEAARLEAESLAALSEKPAPDVSLGPGYEGNR